MALPRPARQQVTQTVGRLPMHDFNLRKCNMENTNREQELWKEIDKLAFWSSFIAIILFATAYFLIANFLTNGILRDFLLGIISNIIPVFLAFSVSYIFLRKIQAIRSETDNEKLANHISSTVLSMLRKEITNSNSLINSQMNQIKNEIIQNKPQDSAKIKILFVGSNPIDTQRIQLTDEARSIRDGLKSSKYGSSFELIQELGARKSDLQSLLLEHKPHILHFSGHSRDNYIVMEDSSSHSALLSKAEFCKLISVFKNQLQLVVLNGYSNLGESVAKEIDHVIGTDDRPLSDSEAILFTASFYHALGNNVDLETAYDLACTRLAEDGAKYLYFKPKKEGRKFLLPSLQN